MRCYAQNARIETGGGETLAVGREEILRRYEPMFAEFPAIAIRKLNSFTVGPYVVQEEEEAKQLSRELRRVLKNASKS